MLGIKNQISNERCRKRYTFNANKDEPNFDPHNFKLVVPNHTLCAQTIRMMHWVVLNVNSESLAWPFRNPEVIRHHSYVHLKENVMGRLK